MKHNVSEKKQELTLDVAALAATIAEQQRESGEIPWCAGEKTDPWDHVEAAMGLSVGGYFREAELAFDWLAGTQLEDGSWYAAYREGRPEDRTKDANMSSYIAVGAFHHFLVTGNRDFLARMWEPVRAGIAFALDLQAPGGEVHWARSPEGDVDPMALLTGTSSIHMSLKCGLAMARILGHETPGWEEARCRMGDAIRNRPHSFNIGKSRFSMDWFYPILCGAVTGDAARQRMERYWKKFVVEDLGVRCVSDQPWVTIAETAEFVLTLAAMGDTRLAHIVFNWILGRRYESGSFWCGFTFPDMTIWPEEKLTWTNGVVLMAADALYGLTPAASLFDHRFWDGALPAGGDR